MIRAGARAAEPSGAPIRLSVLATPSAGWQPARDNRTPLD